MKKSKSNLWRISSWQALQFDILINKIRRPSCWSSILSPSKILLKKISQRLRLSDLVDQYVKMSVLSRKIKIFNHILIKSHKGQVWHPFWISISGDHFGIFFWYCSQAYPACCVKIIILILTPNPQFFHKPAGLWVCIHINKNVSTMKGVNLSPYKVYKRPKFLYIDKVWKESHNKLYIFGKHTVKPQYNPWYTAHSSFAQVFLIYRQICYLSL